MLMYLLFFLNWDIKENTRYGAKGPHPHGVLSVNGWTVNFLFKHQLASFCSNQYSGCLSTKV